MLCAMKEERIRSLIQQISKGKLSRNKHFVRYLDPEVREARHRRDRLSALTALLSESEPDVLTLEKEEGSRDIWKLVCSFSKWAFSWSAFLNRYEIELLRENGRVRKMLDGV